MHNYYEYILKLHELLKVLYVYVFAGKDDPRLVSTLLGLAGVSSEPREREKAKSIYKRIISILENAKGATCEGLGTPLLHLGYMALEEKNPEDAELYIRRYCFLMLCMFIAYKKF
jgi:hypothetical protein